MLDLLNLPLWLNIPLFLLAAAVVWISGTRLSIYADLICQLTGMGRAFMGLILLATATELPEIATNSAGALRDQPVLVLASMTGGIAMQTTILAVADFMVGGAALTFLVRRRMGLLQSVTLVVLLASL